MWVDGIASHNGTVCQFVAMPFGSEYSIESQLTGKDSVAGIQIEVTPSPPRSLPDTVPSSGSNHPDGTIQILIKDLSADYIPFKIKKTTQIGRIMNAACDKQGYNISSVRFLYQATWIGPTDTSETLCMKHGDIIEIKRVLIGGGPDPLWQMAMAAGGRIRRHIAKDEHTGWSDVCV